MLHFQKRLFQELERFLNLLGKKGSRVFNLHSRHHLNPRIPMAYIFLTVSHETFLKNWKPSTCSNSPFIFFLKLCTFPSQRRVNLCFLFS